MQGHLYLEFAGSFLTFSLQAAAACLACICFTRLLRQPQHRFMVWFVFLVASGLYWLRLFGDIGLLLVRPSAGLAISGHGIIPAREHFLLPAAWSVDLGRLDMVVAAIYFAGVLWLAGSHAWRFLRLRALVKLGSRPSPGLASLLDGLRREFGVRRCELLVLPGLISPATVYWRHPRILLPESCNGQEATPWMSDVLRHELVHIVRSDYLIAAISDAVCAFVFFHPAVWYARKQMRLERELACDLAAVSDCPEQRANYADTLAHFVRLHMLQQQNAAPGMDFAGSASFLSRRIHCILEEPVKTPWWKKFSAATAGLALWMVFAFSLPGLGIVLDFSGNRAQANGHGDKRTTAPVALLHKLRSMAKAHTAKTEPGAMADPVVLPDTLTSLRVHDRVPETAEPFQFPQDDSGDTLAEGPAVNTPAWSEQSPASPGFSGPSAESIVIATIDGIAASERREHAEGREHGR